MAAPRSYLEPIPAEWFPAGLDPATARVMGADEVGRGALIGPLVLGACVLPAGWIPEGLRDSKLTTPAARERIARELLDRAECWIEEVPAPEIDRFGIGRANQTGFARLVERACADLALIDGNLRLPTARPYRSIVKGERFAPVAAASILAKWYRDTLMAALEAALPGRGFAQAGYPTAQNIAAIARFGRTPWHRNSFRITALGEQAIPASREALLGAKETS